MTKTDRERQRKAPILRFKGFTDAWEQRKLGEMMTERKILRFDSREFPLSSFIKNKGVVPKSSRYDRSFLVKSNSKKYKETRLGDFIYSSNNLDTGSIGLNNYGNAVISPVYSVFTSKDTENLETSFINLLFKKNFYKNKMLRFRQGVTYGQWKIKENDFLNLKVYTSNSIEIEKIIAIFSKISQCITLYERKLKLLSQAKKYFLDNLFAEKEYPNLRFKGFTDAWEQRKLKELGNIKRGASPRPISDPKWFDENGKYGWLRISDVTSQNGQVFQIDQHLSSIGEEKTVLISSPHLIISIAATVGKPCINYIPTAIHDGFVAFLDYKFNLDFMFEWFNKNQNIWLKYGQPGAQINLNSSIIGNQKIKMPEENEQENIAKLFNILNNLLALYENKQQHLTEIKKTLLNTMFI